MSAPTCQTENPSNHRIRRMTKTVHNMIFPLSSFLRKGKACAKSVALGRILA